MIDCLSKLFIITYFQNYPNIVLDFSVSFDLYCLITSKEMISDCVLKLLLLK